MIHTLADVTVSATATAISATSIRANWVLMQGVTISATARIGDSSITTTRGATMGAAKDAVSFPPCGNTNVYDLSTIYVLGTASDKISVLYGTT
jgi:hypothetical protein